MTRVSEALKKVNLEVFVELGCFLMLYGVVQRYLIIKGKETVQGRGVWSLSMNFCKSFKGVGPTSQFKE
ncbi:hypothetical protein L2E82_47422 [Cichorium intybus]|uniref:Uncharacterized protein n=1 Tax=Cichorium intybus TaxID=13427 RepID=A0ACB8YVJ5_CICIN|nr:hypothetical protein L2E82_47422 [Cichorium intybus]